MLPRTASRPTPPSYIEALALSVQVGGIVITPVLPLRSRLDATRMTGSGKRKGDRAEREAAALLSRLLALPVRRLLGAGRTDDKGDLDGIDGWAIQVADWTDLARAVRQKPLDAELQAAHAGQRHGAALIRLRGGEFRIVMTPQTWATIVTETRPPLPPNKAPPTQGPPFPPERPPSMTAPLPQECTTPPLVEAGHLPPCCTQAGRVDVRGVWALRPNR